jgi:hypothetical protein
LKLPWWVKTGAILAALVVGLSLTSLASYSIEYVLEGPDVRNCVATGQIGNKPMPEALAKLIGEQCREALARNNITARFERAHSWPVNLAASTIGLLLDPIRFLLAIVFVTGSAVLLLRAARKAFLG